MEISRSNQSISATSTLVTEDTLEFDNVALSKRFTRTGGAFITLIVLSLTLGLYQCLLMIETRTVGEWVNSYIQSSKHTSASSIGDELAKKIPKMRGALIFNQKGAVVYMNHLTRSQFDFSSIRQQLADQDTGYEVMGPSLQQLSTWTASVTGEFEPITYVTRIRAGEKSALYLVLALDHRAALVRQRNVVFGLSVLLLAAISLLFWLLLGSFKRSLRMVESQECTLNQQITRLSDLLASNKAMQKSIKTASARAVELNEQFLRRVGADLHDGPAQMIGYSVLRLNQAINDDKLDVAGHELHAIKDALDESLEEIRGISSGLVLPELENMTLEECLRKVVILHGAHSDVKVAQFYHDLPNVVSLPIKICAYRFVQEGLNNAHRHGQAKKCRLTVNLKGSVLQISLKDNGKGFRKSQLIVQGGSLGLTGLKDRIESLGGTLNINSELGVGTALKLSIDLDDES